MVSTQVAALLGADDGIIDTRLQLAMVAAWVFQHATFVIRARAAKRGQRQQIARMGRIDDSMIELLVKTKIGMNADGTVKDEARYKALINN